MKKNISARHFDLSDRLRKRAEEEMDSLTKFFEPIISCDLVLTEEEKGHRRTADLKVKVNSGMLTGTGTTNDIYSAMGEAFEKVRAQLRKHKEKLKEKNVAAIAETKATSSRPNTDVDELER